ncbi:MAG: diaminopimelate epimerase [Actinobacteria bacterium]|nr:diaminopimelate epimerase [Actinomycetota bacterium]
MTDELRFEKYHGTGNDFVFLEDLGDERPLDPEVVAALCDRRFGVGADGVIRVVRGERADFFMDYRNADGSLAEMCGNGIRCLGKFVYDHGFTDATQLEVDTRGGVKHLSLDVRDGAVREVTVGMGPPSFAKAAIPMRGPAWETFLSEPFDIGNGMTVKASALSMGNPHLVLFVDDDPSRYHVAHIGPVLERHELFPEKTNVEFVQLQNGELKARVWERGSGETMACGTGACAVAVAANEAGLVPARALVRFPGGALTVERLKDDVLLTGTAEKVFDGILGADWLAARKEGRAG